MILKQEWNLLPLHLPKLTDRHNGKIKNYFSKHLDFSEKSNFDAELARWKNATEPESEQEGEQEGAMFDCSPQQIFRHSQGAVDLSNHACQTHQLWTLLLSPTPSEAMDSVINDRRSIKWPCYAVNSSRNGLHSPTPKGIYDTKSNWRRI